ncbi:hypothetical protein E2C01_093452 [Portunus trituberculatus]|uniref:Major facilitator superfamily associated domain-containing protein n=1 Tax=Portunus trituberculatus TaxID=210409 RepID=A0A5B7JJ00_PORTR|nr:hypothetical protein [Portunus trituberculatus]
MQSCCRSHSQQEFHIYHQCTLLTGVITEWLGYTSVLIVSVLSTGLRYSLYYTVSNPWYLLPVELLNDLSYSLFQSVMAVYASHIAPSGAQATVQSLVKAAFSIGEFCFNRSIYATLPLYMAAALVSIHLLSLRFSYVRGAVSKRK